MLEQAQKDNITGFFQKWDLNVFLEKLIIESEVKEKSFTIVFIHPDNKKFNRRFGSIFEDEIFKYIASNLRLTLNEKECYLFRYAWDEFIGVFPDQEPKEVLQFVSQFNYNLYHRPFLFKNKLQTVTFSYGIAVFPFDGKKKEELIYKAHDAAYSSKRRNSDIAILLNRIKYLKLNKIFIFIIAIAIISLSHFLLLQLNFGKILPPAIANIKSKATRLLIKKNNLDKIITKNGSIFEGHILAETNDKIILNLIYEKGEGLITLDKPDIAKIYYGSGAFSQKDNKIPIRKEN